MMKGTIAALLLAAGQVFKASAIGSNKDEVRVLNQRKKVGMWQGRWNEACFIHILSSESEAFLAGRAD
jgi:hypothetical protein